MHCMCAVFQCSDPGIGVYMRRNWAYSIPVLGYYIAD